MIKHLSEYRNKYVVKGLVDEIKAKAKKEITLMEICGGHTMAIHKYGLSSLLPHHIHLLSGPGCPVCVTAIGFIDHAIALAKETDTIIATFGDLMRVPGSTSSLEKQKAAGNDIRMVYSIMNALEIAKKNKTKNIIFLGIGFETTAPGTAAGIRTAEKEQLDNFYVLSAHKVMPPAMAALIDEGVKIDGYICPGHVSTITGLNMYTPFVEKYNIGCVVSGFEPTDMLYAILTLVRQHENNSPKVENAYSRAVKKEGNTKAQQLMYSVFEFNDEPWRGFGTIKHSGLSIKNQYSQFDASVQFKPDVEPPKEVKGCICGNILKGLNKPTDCKLFGNKCNPTNPVGACMVSNEGACHAYYKYQPSS